MSWIGDGKGRSRDQRGLIWTTVFDKRAFGGVDGLMESLGSRDGM